ncbi:recombinase family protein [Streptomyces sp. 135]|uniref:recombinase family protein n=1 Tax=Streptomyces sp. 135 TaxID=2838850 RepID=UPI001CBEE92C|nr:recombinase family protein [Streptomyces sp. 135]
MSRRPKASLYARLSVAADTENVSLEGMITDMRALCAKEGIDVLEPIHVDDGKSGGFRDRDEYQQWLNDAKTGAAQFLVNYHTDRLTREGLNVAAQILDVIEGKDPSTGRPNHKPVHLLDCFGIDSRHGDAFRFRFVIQAEVGRAERERIRDRSRDRNRRLRTVGRWSGGQLPFGYKPVPNPETDEDGKPKGWVLDIEPTEAKLIRDAADALLKPEPDTLNMISRRWNHMGVKPRRAKEWCRSTIASVLTGDHIMGRAVVNGHPVRDAEGNILAPWPAVLTVGQVTALRKALTPKPDKKKGGRHPSRLLSGLIRCSGCQRPLGVERVKRRTSNPEPLVTYRCKTRTQGQTCVSPVSATAEHVEAYVTGRFLATVGHMPMYVERTFVSGVEELAALEEELRDTMATLATKATEAGFVKLQELQAKREYLATLEPERRTDLVPTGQTMAEYWEGALVDDRRRELDNAFEELTLKPGLRGPKGFDSNRLVLRWRETPDAGDED